MAARLIPANICNWSQLNDAMRRVRSVIQGHIPEPKSAVILGMTANQALSSGTLGIAAVAWDRVIPKRPNGDEELPDWLTSYGTAIEFAQTGMYLVSWAIDWTANGSTQDNAVTYMSHFQASTGAYANLGVYVSAVEDTGLTVSLIYPATPFEIDKGDKIEIIVGRLAGDSTAGWTARALGCFINIVKL